jgi:hypothetical protein
MAFERESERNSFDEEAYFGSDGHCCAVALALHGLTGWPLYELWTPGNSVGHVVVRSPLGYLDAWGLGAGDGYQRAMPVTKEFVERARRYVEEEIIPSELWEEESEKNLDEWGEECTSREFWDRMATNERCPELAVPLAMDILRRCFPDFVSERPTEQLKMFV